ncbi:MAG: hypothetical protein RLZZ399_873 [Verrucomicrobiota bacterium]|jgi:aldose 1-epimerase
MKPRFLLLPLLALAALGCASALAAIPEPTPFGQLPDGTPVDVYTLSNSRGIRMRVMTYGATVLSLETPDKRGNRADIVLGFSTLEAYLKDSPYFGCVVGRYANRIAQGKFSIGDRAFTLAVNSGSGSGACTLHGGKRGLDKVVWKAQGLEREGAQGLKFTYTSQDGDEGFPGNLQLTMTYWLQESNDWEIEYEATTDRPTPVNLSHHSYFNLRGEGDPSVLGHELQILASRFTPVNSSLIPTGECRTVRDTPLDFSSPAMIGARIDSEDEQLRFGGGYDHNWVLDSQDGSLKPAASLHEPLSGRWMEVLTTEPGIQFYTGNFLDGKLVGKSGKPYVKRSGLCLETQHYPDSPNQPGFPTTILDPGKTYRSKTVYRFGTR